MSRCRICSNSVLVPMALLCWSVFTAAAQAEEPDAAAPFLNAVRTYADTMLDKGRDHWGQSSPLFISILDRRTHELIPFDNYVRWTHPNSNVDIVSYTKDGKKAHGFGSAAADRMPDSANLGHDEHLYLTLYKLSEVTGDAQYAKAADEALRYFWLNCQDANTGMMAWGEHMAWHLPEDTWWSSATEGHSRIHEPAPWPGELWQRCYVMDSDVVEALRRYAMGVWKWQVANHDKAMTNRHVYPDGYPNVARRGREYPRLVGQFCRYWADAYAHSDDEQFRAEMLKGIESFVTNSIRRAKPNGALPFGTAPKLQNYYNLGHQFLMLERLHEVKGVVPDALADRIDKLISMTETVILTKLDHRLDAKADHEVHGYLRAAQADSLEPGDARKKGKPGWDDPAIAYTGKWRTAGMADRMLRYARQSGHEDFRHLGVQGVDLTLTLLGEAPDYPTDMTPGSMARLITSTVRAHELTGQRRYLARAERFGQDALELFFDEHSALPAVLSLQGKSHHRVYEARTGGDELMYALLKLHVSLQQHKG